MIDTTTLNHAMQSSFGRDVAITLARAPRWGHADTCLLVKGRRHREVATELVRQLAQPGATRFAAQVHESRAGVTPRFSYTLLSIKP